jgi:hypothetical protein
LVTLERREKAPKLLKNCNACVLVCLSARSSECEWERQIDQLWVSTGTTSVDAITGTQTLIREFVLRGKERILRRVSERKNKRFWREKHQSERDGSIGVCEAIRKSTIRKIQKSDRERGRRQTGAREAKGYFFYFSAFGQNGAAKNYSNELEKEGRDYIQEFDLNGRDYIQEFLIRLFFKNFDLNGRDYIQEFLIRLFFKNFDLNGRNYIQEGIFEILYLKTSKTSGQNNWINPVFMCFLR